LAAFLGIGQRYHALPWNVLTYDTGKGGYVISATKDQLMSAPHFAAGEEPFARTERHAPHPRVLGGRSAQPVTQTTLIVLYRS
jgi:hypothetical protein